MAITKMSSGGIATYTRFNDIATGTVVGADPSFVISGSDYNFYTSSDGITWSQKVQATNIGTVYTIFKNNNLYYAGCSNGLYWCNVFTTLNYVAQLEYKDSKILNGVAYNLLVSGGSTHYVQGAFHYSGFTMTTPYELSWNGVDTLVVVGNGGIFTKNVTPANVINPPFAWTQRGNPVAGQLTAVTYGAGKFVAANANNLIYSADGATWTVSQAGSFSSVRFFNGLFVAVGYPGIIYTSTDGVTWTSRLSAGGTIALQSPAFGNGIWVVPDANTSNAIYTSTNGTTWTARAFGFAGIRANKGFFL